MLFKDKVEWKDKTCEKCVYRWNVFCRRFPPMTEIRQLEKIGYNYWPACAEYKEI